MTVRIDGSTGISGLDGSSSIPAIQGANNFVGIFYPSANTVAISTSGIERLRINSGGSVGIGTNAPDRALSISGSNATIGITNTEAFGGAMSIDAPLSGLAQIDIAGANALRFNTNSAERMRVTATGNVGIGTASPLTKLHIDSGAAGYGLTFEAVAETSRKYQMGIVTGGSLAFYDTAAATERMRISSAGRLLINTTDSDPVGGNVPGTAIVAGIIITTANLDIPIYANRKGNDGTIISLCQDGIAEGSISVSGTTVTYGAFSGSHWSQLSDNSRPDILVGTVVETIDEKCVWPGQDNEQLVKFKVSDTPESKRVYGVFMSWDNDDDENNDAYITSLGAYLIRIAAGHTVEGGDLLVSNGDGCAVVQSDDIIRSSTIGKVTSNIPTHTYDDGSYTVPCVLYCG